MAKLTDEQVNKEIEMLSKSQYVKLARRERNIRNKKRQYLYSLRSLERRGKQLAEQGITMASLDEIETRIFDNGTK